MAHTHLVLVLLTGAGVGVGATLIFLALEIGRNLMAAIDNLNGAVQANTAAVNKAVTKIDELKQGTGEAAVQAAADQVAADAARLDAKASEGDPTPVPFR